MNIKWQSREADDAAIELPLVKLDKEEVFRALFVYSSNVEDLYQDALLKLQTWIVNYAEEMVKPIRDSSVFTEDEVEAIKKKTCVISPLTLTLYLFWLQKENFSKMTDVKKEKLLLAKCPERFKARYWGNAASRNAREPSEEEDLQRSKPESTKTSRMEKKHMSFIEFLREFGEAIRNQK